MEDDTATLSVMTDKLDRKVKKINNDLEEISDAIISRDMITSIYIILIGVYILCMGFLISVPNNSQYWLVVIAKSLAIFGGLLGVFSGGFVLVDCIYRKKEIKEIRGEK